MPPPSRFSLSRLFSLFFWFFFFLSFLFFVPSLNGVTRKHLHIHIDESSDLPAASRSLFGALDLHPGLFFTSPWAAVVAHEPTRRAPPRRRLPAPLSRRQPPLLPTHWLATRVWSSPAAAVPASYRARSQAMAAAVVVALADAVAVVAAAGAAGAAAAAAATALALLAAGCRRAVPWDPEWHRMATAATAGSCGC